MTARLVKSNNNGKEKLGQRCKKREQVGTTKMLHEEWKRTEINYENQKWLKIVSFTMETDNLNKEAIFSESGISTNNTCTISFHSESSLKINERFFFYLTIKWKCCRPGAGGRGALLCWNVYTLNLIKGRVFKSIILFKLKNNLFYKGKLAFHKIKSKSLSVAMFLRQTYLNTTCLAHNGN